MANALCHPSDDLRTQALTEIKEFGMSRDDVSVKLHGRLRLASSRRNPWFLRVGGARSLGKLQISSEAVISWLVQTAFDQGTFPELREEALRALKTLDAENYEMVL